MAAETAVGGWGQCITAGSLGVPLGESTPGLGSHWRASVTYAREVSSLNLNVSLASLSKCGLCRARHAAHSRRIGEFSFPKKFARRRAAWPWALAHSRRIRQLWAGGLVLVPRPVQLYFDTSYFIMSQIKNVEYQNRTHGFRKFLCHITVAYMDGAMVQLYGVCVSFSLFSA